MFALVDEADHELLSQYTWSAGKAGHKFYPVTSVNGKLVRMHKMLLEGCLVDHINQDALDNRSSNLRLATKQGNAANSKLASTNTSGCRGVHWDASRSKWAAQIYVNGKSLHLGRHSTKEEAAAAYEAAALKHFGEFRASPRTG